MSDDMKRAEKCLKPENSSKGHYEIIDGEKYFCLGNWRTRVTEYFSDCGSSIEELIVDAIQFAAKKPKDRFK